MARPKNTTETVATPTVATETVANKYITLSPFYTKKNDFVVYKAGDEANDLDAETLKSCLEKGLIELVK